MVIVNGEPTQVTDGQTILAFLTARQTPVENIVVERNGEIVRRVDYDTTYIDPNDNLELISFVGGGR
ncbi:hypothetical protein FD04_GL001128 [Secundilactobacillus odoratitofui DSM 19909 = JCM 15043]|uniref:Thiamine biosynthesis protein ThiS n=1 Tax=Secundilactobacillus odoratitofui DSM 19909 = JCM 15043 TaxID=1423776 RepID=A0A0R1LQR5_9LACO|nr:sulfur carrier protein ThiS [Secundilactobacillus odoratitofui]KRK98150.1 hypothetical protein FD04_GL001128 [Secundilactobacillus odoratitofui DSM 19909 = JCM 15043]